MVWLLLGSDSMEVCYKSQYYFSEKRIDFPNYEIIISTVGIDNSTPYYWEFKMINQTEKVVLPKSRMTWCQWDDVPRIAGFFNQYLGAKPGIESLKTSKAFFLASVNRLMNNWVDTALAPNPDSIGYTQMSVAMNLLFFGSNYFVDAREGDIPPGELEGKWAVQSLGDNAAEIGYQAPSVTPIIFDYGWIGANPYPRRQPITLGYGPIDYSGIKRVRSLVWAEALEYYTKGVKLRW
jgi:hypothetical protein